MRGLAMSEVKDVGQSDVYTRKASNQISNETIEESHDWRTILKELLADLENSMQPR